MGARWFAFACLCLLASGGQVALADSKCSKVEHRDDYEVITPTEFRKLPNSTPEGKKFTFHHLRFLKLFNNSELKVYGGYKDGGPVRPLLHGRLVVENRTTRKGLIKALNGNQDSEGNRLKTKVSNVQVFGVGKRLANGDYGLSVNRVIVLDDFPAHFEELYGKLPEGDAQARLDLRRDIKQAVQHFPSEQELLKPLVEKLQEEAKALEREGLPELPAGVEEHIEFARRHEDIPTLRAVWLHDGVEEEQKAAVGRVLREELNARLYKGQWYAYEDFKAALGFALADNGSWVPQNRLDLLAAAEVEKQNRRKILFEKPAINRGLLEAAMKNGNVIPGMPKSMVLGAAGGFPVAVDRVREEYKGHKLTWELWVLKDGLRVFLLNGFVFKKDSPGGSE